MDSRLSTYLFPRLLWRNSQASAFSFSDCSFKVQRSKESTARVVGYKQLGIKNSLTMEASFAGANFGRLAGMHFTPAVLREMGHGLCDSILDYFDPDQARLSETYSELVSLFPDGKVEDEEDSAGSDDNPDEDCADPKELEQRVLQKRKHKRSRKDGGKKGQSASLSVKSDPLGSATARHRTPLRATTRHRAPPLATARHNGLLER